MQFGSIKSKLQCFVKQRTGSKKVAATPSNARSLRQTLKTKLRELLSQSDAFPNPTKAQPPLKDENRLQFANHLANDQLISSVFLPIELDLSSETSNFTQDVMSNLSEHASVVFHNSPSVSDNTATTNDSFLQHICRLESEQHDTNVFDFMATEIENQDTQAIPCQSDIQLSKITSAGSEVSPHGHCNENTTIAAESVGAEIPSNDTNDLNVINELVEIPELDEFHALKRYIAAKVESALQMSSLINLTMGINEFPSNDINLPPLYSYGYQAGQEEGTQDGYVQGYEAGIDTGYQQYLQDLQEVQRLAYDTGYAAGHTHGLDIQLTQSQEDQCLALKTAFEAGYAEGLRFALENGKAMDILVRNTGFEAGKERGYASGFSDGKASALEEKASLDDSSASLLMKISTHAAQDGLKGKEQQSTNELAKKCFEPTLNCDDWVPIGDIGNVPNPAAAYLPTIIYENTKVLDCFLKAFNEDPKVEQFHKHLQTAREAFHQLNKEFYHLGLIDNVVEYLRPAEHPNRVQERLQQLQIQYKQLESRYRDSQAKLLSYTERGGAEDIQGEERAGISVLALQELEAECSSWKSQYTHLRNFQQDRLDKLELESKPLRAQVELLMKHNAMIEEQSNLNWGRQKDIIYAHIQDTTKDELKGNITMKMYQDLAQSYRNLEDRVLRFPEQIADLMKDSAISKIALRKEKLKCLLKDSVIEDLEQRLEEKRLRYDDGAFRWDLKESDYQVQIENLSQQLESCEYRKLLSQAELQTDAMQNLSNERDRAVKLYEEEVKCSENLRNELDFVYAMGPPAGVILGDAERLEQQRLPSKIWLPLRSWNRVNTECQGKEREKDESSSDNDDVKDQSTFTNDSQIF